MVSGCRGRNLAGSKCAQADLGCFSILECYLTAQTFLHTQMAGFHNDFLHRMTTTPTIRRPKANIVRNFHVSVARTSIWSYEKWHDSRLVQ